MCLGHLTRAGPCRVPFRRNDSYHSGRAGRRPCIGAPWIGGWSGPGRPRGLRCPVVRSVRCIRPRLAGPARLARRTSRQGSAVAAAACEGNSRNWLPLVWPWSFRSGRRAASSPGGFRPHLWRRRGRRPWLDRLPSHPRHPRRLLRSGTCSPVLLRGCRLDGRSCEECSRTPRSGGYPSRSGCLPRLPPPVRWCASSRRARRRPHCPRPVPRR